MDNVLINITESPVRTVHISWTIKERGNCLVLYEVVDNYYRYIEGEGKLLVSKVELVEVKRVNRGDVFNMAPLLQLKNSLDTISLIMGTGDKISLARG